MRFFMLLAGYGPPPPEGFRPPVFWGEPNYLAGLLGDAVTDLRSEAHVLKIPFASTSELLTFYKQNFGPVIVAYRGIADDPARTAALDRELAVWAEEMNADRGEEPVAFHLEYLLSSAVRVG